MDPRENFDFLSKYVPRTTEYLTLQCEKEVEAMRKENIQKHRVISLVPLLLSKLDVREWVPDSNTFPKFVFKPKEANPPYVSPQLLQQSSHLFQIIHHNPSDLFNGLISIKGTPLYHFVINSSIPSLYGYFSSQEHIQLAFSFYIHVVSTDDVDAGIEMLSPFFKTPCIFRLIENIMTPFCERVRSDARIGDKKYPNTVVETYANEFAKLLIASAPLLTHSHSVILRIMLNKWGLNETSKFIIQVLFKSLGCIWLETNGLQNRTPFFVSVITEILKSRSKTSLIVNKIVEAEPILELPDMYNAFSLQYILILSTCQDFAALIKVMQLKCQLPPSILSIKPETTPPYSVYWFKLFPKRRMPKHNKNRPLVFNIKPIKMVKSAEFDRIWMKIKSVANDIGEEPYDYLRSKKNISTELIDYALLKSVRMLEEEASKFEKLMEYMLHRNELVKWMEITDAHLRMMTTPIAALATNAAYDRQYKYINFAFKKASTFFNSRLTKQTQYLLLLQRYLTLYITPNIKKELDTIDSWWAAFLDKKNRELDSFITLTSQSSSALFWDCVEKLRTVNKDNLIFSFTTIMLIVKALYELSRSHNFQGKYDEKNMIIVIGALIGETAIIGHCTGLISVYIIIGSLGMDNILFKDLCLPQEQKAWVSLEAQMFLFLESDMNMYERVIKIQEVLRNIEKEGDN
jgi:hypothetical protein